MGNLETQPTSGTKPRTNTNKTEVQHRKLKWYGKSGPHKIPGDEPRCW